MLKLFKKMIFNSSKISNINDKKVDFNNSNEAICYMESLGIDFDKILSYKDSVEKIKAFENKNRF